ncbi:MAG: AEC family transporter [Chloroflexota bacterium]|nr:AEC family transporter [Chloroflexota bacterium]
MLPLLRVVYNIIIPIFVIVGLAVLLGWRFQPDVRTLSRLVIYLFGPFLVMSGLANSALQASEIGKLVLATLLISLLFTLLGWVVAHLLLRIDRQLESAFLLSVVLMNSGNYGLPLSEFAFGAAGLQRAIVIFVTMSVVTHSLGIYLASYGSASLRQSLRNIFSVPLLPAAFVGLLLNLEVIHFPLPLERVMVLLGQAAVPSMLVVLGLQLTRMQIRSRWDMIGLASFMRLVLSPLIAYGVAAMVGLSELSQQVVIVVASMPTAVITTVLATEFDSDAEFTTGVVAISTLSSAATLSILLYLLQK